MSERIILPHISFFEKLDTTIQTSDGKTVEVWEFNYTNDEGILSKWAKHFREHYCKDSDIDELREDTGKSRKDYLISLKFPDIKDKPGPSVRSGDFGEILVADFLEFIEKYEIFSRYTRYNNKINRNSSPQGSDVIGFRFVDKNKRSSMDELIIYEAKAKFVGNKKSAEKRLQSAINDSKKDKKYRIGGSLNAMKQRLIELGMNIEVKKVGRFQNEAERAYKTINGAVALVSNSNYSSLIASSANTNKHPFKKNLRLIIIKGNNMMNLVHDLYKRAADEA